MTIWNDNASLAATTRGQHAQQHTFLRLEAYDEDLAAIRLMRVWGIDSSVVRYAARVATDRAAAELVRLERFAQGGAA